MWWHLILVDDLCDDISNQVAWGFHVAIAGATGVGNGNASSRIIRQYSGAQDNAAELGCIDVVVGLFLGFHLGIPGAAIIFYFVFSRAHVRHHNEAWRSITQRFHTVDQSNGTVTVNCKS